MSFFNRKPGGVEEASPAEVERQLADGQAILLDVRDADEWAEGHVPGSVWIPLQALPGRLAQLPKDRTIYVICHSGGRSARAVQFLKANGYAARNVAGGIMKWPGRLER